MPTLARIKQKLIDGRYRWGHVSERTGRYGGKSIRLVVYPPDASTFERRCARLTRHWPGVSLTLVPLLTVVVLVLIEIAVLVVAGGLGVLAILCGVALERIARPVTEHAAIAFVSVSLLTPSETARQRYDRIREIAEDLHTAEQYLDHGEIRWARYRVLWAEGYTLTRT